jgi:CRP/FNR family cyclic AMP-dependent transcriptional regulator
MMQQELLWIVDGFLVSNIGGFGVIKVMKKIDKSLFNIGDKRYFMCLLEAGEINIRHEGRTLETVNSEGITGEMALVGDDPRRSSDPIILQDATLIPINQQKYLELVKLNPGFALLVMTAMARMIREMNERIRLCPHTQDG